MRGRVGRLLYLGAGIWIAEGAGIWIAEDAKGAKGTKGAALVRWPGTVPGQRHLDRGGRERGERGGAGAVATHCSRAEAFGSRRGERGGAFASFANFVAIVIQTLSPLQGRVARGELRETWQDPMTWDDALAECRARFPLQAVTVDGATWSCLDTGAGDATLLLLPGAMGFADTSFHFVLAFAPQLRVISVSYPPALAEGDRLVDGLAALLAARGVVQAHVVGGSYSGLVAQRLADRYPQRVASLILANTWAADPRRARWFRPAAWLVARAPAWLLQRLATGYIDRFLPGADPATRFWRSYFAAILPAFTPALIANRLHAFASLDSAEWPSTSGWLGPVLVVESAADRLFGERSRRMLRQRYAQANLVKLDCPGHAAALTHVGDYVRLYEQWLASLHGLTDGDSGQGGWGCATIDPSVES